MTSVADDILEGASAAQETFYRSFANTDIETMSALWSQSQDCTCIHPGSVALTGYAAVCRSWEIILAAEAMKIEHTPVASFIDATLATFIVTEHLFIPSRNLRGEPLATNAFRLEPDGWRMVLHHGSPKPVDPHSGGLDDAGGTAVH